MQALRDRDITEDGIGIDIGRVSKFARIFFFFNENSNDQNRTPPVRLLSNKNPRVRQGWADMGAPGENIG